MTSINRDIAIIGGGSSGPTLLIYLAEKIKNQSSNLSGINIHLVDPKGFAGGGIAYGECHSSHRLNSTRDEMSPWEPDEFNKWCEAQGLRSDIQSFNLRADYGRYIKQRVDEAIKTLEAHGANVIKHKHHVDIRPDNHGRFKIIDENKRAIVSNIAASDITLSVGYGPNENFANLRKFTGQGFINSPYDNDAIDQITPGSTISFIGAGPALYDFANALPLNSAEIKLNVFSKTGKLLATRLTERELTETSQIPSYLTEGENRFDDFEDLRTAVIGDFKSAANNGERTPRRVALDVMKNIRGYLETQNPQLAKQFLKSSLRGALCHAATPVPFESQVRLQSFDPKIIKERLNGNINFEDVFDFKIKKEDGTFTASNYIINATGHGRHNSAILEALKANGLACIDERFDVLATDDTGHILKGSGINCIGPSVHFGIDGVESFAPFAEAIAEKWVSSFKQKVITGHKPPVPNTLQASG